MLQFEQNTYKLQQLTFNTHIRMQNKAQID